MSTTTSQDLNKMKAKIAMLLAKAESTTFPEERDTFNEAAEKLMLRLGIARAELESIGETKPEEVVQDRRLYKGIFAIANMAAANAIARGFGHITVLQSSLNRGRLRAVYFIGVKSDVEDFLQLLDSLDLQVMSALAQWRKETRDERQWLTAMEKELRDRSFIEGFGSQVGIRLRAARTVQEDEVKGTGTELVLVGKEERVQEYMDRHHPNLRSTTSRRGHDWTGSTAGRRAGEKANLGQKSLGNRKALEG